jgi:hypothetical protein
VRPTTCLGAKMKSPLLATLVLSLTLAGCSSARESRLNPFNWFGTSRSVSTLVPAGGFGFDPADRRVLVDQVTQLEINRTPGGAILVATGLPQTQGWWDAELIAENDGQPVNGVLRLRFVVAEPTPGTPVASRVSSPQSREVTAALFLSEFKLAEVRQILVTGLGNARTVSR